MLVADGLGGLPLELGGKTELETARTPNLDACVREGVCGLSIPVLPGITPGSGPGHLGLFGYDPLEYRIGRGILEALGINFQVGPRDVAVRGNFCTVDDSGMITDRRAGRPTTERCVAMCQKLQTIKVPGVEVFVEPVREHRFVVVFRGDNLGDPSTTPIRKRSALAPLHGEGERRALAEHRQGRQRTSSPRPARCSRTTPRPTWSRCAASPAIRRSTPCRRSTACKPACIAVYPMYKGLARLVGMDIARRRRARWPSRSRRCRKLWASYDFFFLHYKYTDSTGEDGNFAAKVEMIERLDAEIPKIRGLNPDVLIVTGDHSTPSKLQSHSWHPVPTLLWAKTCRPDGVDGVRRIVLPARRPGADRGEVSDAAGDGPRGAAGQVWGVKKAAVSRDAESSERSAVRS